MNQPSEPKYDGWGKSQMGTLDAIISELSSYRDALAQYQSTGKIEGFGGAILTNPAQCQPAWALLQEWLAECPHLPPVPYHLTTDHAASSYGQPVLVDNNGNAYGPDDICPTGEPAKYYWPKD